MTIDRGFWRGRRVFVTGHTGFTGSWLCQALADAGARVSGYALSPPTEPSLFELARVEGLLERSTIADVRDRGRLAAELAGAAPEVVVHLAAQPLVRESYRDPAGTWEINVLGTVNLLEAVRGAPGVRAVVVVTSDKCYENREWVWGYRERDRLGGRDPYSSSKAAAEIAAAAWARSFFPAGGPSGPGAAIATARAGNIIGGGDFAAERLVPDFFRAALAGEPLRIRSPLATRPWQHVLEPVEGYLLLAQRLAAGDPAAPGAWNFGPSAADVRRVRDVVAGLVARWGACQVLEGPAPDGLHEAHALTLDCAKARSQLGWEPRWAFEEALERTVDWTRRWQAGEDPHALCLHQIRSRDGRR